MNDYLWDKSGETDVDVERLEQMLGVFAQSTPPPPLVVPALVVPGVVHATRSSRWIGVALLAASVAVVIGGVTLAFVFRPAAAGWAVTIADRRATFAVGSWLETRAG